MNQQELSQIAATLGELCQRVTDADGQHLDRLFYAIQLAQMEAEAQALEADVEVTS